MRLIEFTRSNLPNRRFKIQFEEPYQIIHFGSKPNAYVDHGNVGIRDNYIMRKYRANQDWSVLNEGEINDAILWGPTKSIEGNLALMLQKFNIQDCR